MRKFLWVCLLALCLMLPAGARDLNLKNSGAIIDVGRNIAPASLLLTNASIVNVFTGEIVKSTVAIKNGVIAGIGDYTRGEKVIDLQGKYLLPGLFNTAVPMDNYLVNVTEYTRAVIPHGTTTVICDPHAVVNVLGDEGIKYYLRFNEFVPLDIFLLASACVPDSLVETSGASWDIKALAHLLNNERILGLTHLGPVSDITDKNPDLLSKLLVCQKAGKVIIGSAPLLQGMELQAYLSSAINMDANPLNYDLAREKLAGGLTLLLPGDFASPESGSLIKLIQPGNCDRFILTTGAASLEDLSGKGDMDEALRRAVALGIDPVMAVRMASLNPAERFGIDNLGAVAPGYQADLVAVDDLKDFKVYCVVKQGNLAFIGGKYLFAPKTASENLEALTSKVLHTVYLQDLSLESFAIPGPASNIKIIKLAQDSSATVAVSVQPHTVQGAIEADVSRDIVKVAVLERHHNSGNVGLGFVQGLGLKEGALASSKSYNSNNIIAVGTNDPDMLLAVKEVLRLEGGLVAVNNGKVLGALPLPLAGLMSDFSLEEVSQYLENLKKITHNLGCTSDKVFELMGSLTSTQLPGLRITDLGLVEVKSQKLVPLKEP